MENKFSCPVCRGRGYTDLFPAKDRMFGFPGEFSFVRCLRCDVVSLFPYLTEKELKQYYPAKQYYVYSAEESKGFFSALRRNLIQREYRTDLLAKLFHLFIPRVPAVPSYVPNGKILDMGCGTGDTLLMFKRLGWKTFGMDIDKSAVDIARKRGVDHVRVGYYRGLSGFPDNFFDAIRLYHVIEHLDDPLLCLQLIKKKLKRNGQLLIGTPNIDSAIAKISGSYWYNLDSPRHLVLFNPETLRRLLASVGFTPGDAEFCSAGGILGSIQYCLADKFNIKVDLINTAWLVILFYPVEWVLDKLKLGDVFVIKSLKTS